jgi:hypothetical protein
VDKRGAEQDRDGRRAENQVPATRRHAAQSDDHLGRTPRRGPLRPTGEWTHVGLVSGTQVRLEGHIQYGGVDKDVTFVSVEAADDVNAAIDAAYRAKYRRYPASFVDAVLTPEAKSATIKLQPRS